MNNGQSYADQHGNIFIFCQCNVNNINISPEIPADWSIPDVLNL